MRSGPCLFVRILSALILEPSYWGLVHLALFSSLLLAMLRIEAE